MTTLVTDKLIDHEYIIIIFIIAIIIIFILFFKF